MGILLRGGSGGAEHFANPGTPSGRIGAAASAARLSPYLHRRLFDAGLFPPSSMKVSFSPEER
jgi:hypothetical protein